MESPIDAVTDQVLGPRDVVTVEGSDAMKYLQSQLSQHVLDMAVGDERWTFLLQPTGKVDVLARVRRSGEDRFELDTDAGYGDVMLARIDRFKIRVAAETSLVEAAGSVRDPQAEADRVAIGWPAMGAEIVPGETIPGGTGLTRVAVSFTKGCYPGQELVERMDSRDASAPRSLRTLTVTEGAAPGDPVVVGGDEVGVLTSVAAGHAIAWIKRSSDVGTTIGF